MHSITDTLIPFLCCWAFGITLGDHVNKAVAVVLNKSDLPVTMQRTQIEQILMLSLLENAVNCLDVMVMSAWTGEGTSELLRWVVKHSEIRRI